LSPRSTSPILSSLIWQSGARRSTTGGTGDSEMSYQHHRKAKLREYNNCCAHCGGGSITPRTHREVLCLDHVQTQATGGGDEFDNFQVLCMRCNTIKGPYVLPKLPPRQPAANFEEAYAMQEKFKHRIMPARRRSGWDQHIPRAVLGY
jgi:hypothetical protein